MSVKRKYNKANIHINGKFVPSNKGKFILDAEYVRDDRTDESLLNSLEQIDETVEENSQEINERIDGMFDHGKIKSDLLPSYVDDIIEGYYYNGTFYLDSEHTQEITGESGKIYSDISVTPAVDYRWGGSAYVVHHAQADWNQSDATAPDYIKNKPSIPADPVQSDWNQSDDTKLDYIKNKPTIPAAQIQADWDQSDTNALDFIKNKPNIGDNYPVVTLQYNASNWSIMCDGYIDYSDTIKVIQYNNTYIGKCSTDNYLKQLVFCGYNKYNDLLTFAIDKSSSQYPDYIINGDKIISCISYNSTILSFCRQHDGINFFDKVVNDLNLTLYGAALNHAYYYQQSLLNEWFYENETDSYVDFHKLLISIGSINPFVRDVEYGTSDIIATLSNGTLQISWDSTNHDDNDRLCLELIDLTANKSVVLEDVATINLESYNKNTSEITEFNNGDIVYVYGFIHKAGVNTFNANEVSNSIIIGFYSWN